MRKVKAKARESLTEDKSSELKSLNEGVLEYILGLLDSQIQEDVSASCDFASAIQECIFDKFGKESRKERFTVC